MAKRKDELSPDDVKMYVRILHEYRLGLYTYNTAARELEKQLGIKFELARLLLRGMTRYNVSDITGERLTPREIGLKRAAMTKATKLRKKERLKIAIAKRRAEIAAEEEAQKNKGP